MVSKRNFTSGPIRLLLTLSTLIIIQSAQAIRNDHSVCFNLLRRIHNEGNIAGHQHSFYKKIKYKPSPFLKKRIQTLRDSVRKFLQRKVNRHRYPIIAIEDAPKAIIWAKKIFDPNFTIKGEITFEELTEGLVKGLDQVENYPRRLDEIESQYLSKKLQIDALEKAKSVYNKNDPRTEIEWDFIDPDGNILTGNGNWVSNWEDLVDQLADAKKELEIIEGKLQEEMNMQAINIKTIENYWHSYRNYSLELNHLNAQVPEEILQVFQRLSNLYRDPKGNKLRRELIPPNSSWQHLRWQQFGLELHSTFWQALPNIKSKEELEKLVKLWDNLSEKDKEILGINKVTASDKYKSWYQRLKPVRYILNKPLRVTALALGLSGGGFSIAGVYNIIFEESITRAECITGVQDSWIDKVKFKKDEKKDDDEFSEDFDSDEDSNVVGDFDDDFSDYAQSQNALGDDFITCAEKYLRLVFPDSQFITRAQIDNYVNDDGYINDPEMKKTVDDLVRDRVMYVYGNHLKSAIIKSKMREIKAKDMTNPVFKNFLSRMDEESFHERLLSTDPTLGYFQYHYPLAFGQKRIQTLIREYLFSELPEEKKLALIRLKNKELTKALAEDLEDILQKRQDYLESLEEEEELENEIKAIYEQLQKEKEEANKEKKEDKKFDLEFPKNKDESEKTDKVDQKSEGPIKKNDENAGENNKHDDEDEVEKS